MARPRTYQGVTLDDLRWAHAEAARFAMKHPSTLPIFERLDNELRAAEAMLGNDPVTAARAMLAAQNAMR